MLGHRARLGQSGFVTSEDRSFERLRDVLAEPGRGRVRLQSIGASRSSCREAAASSSGPRPRCARSAGTRSCRRRRRSRRRRGTRARAVPRARPPRGLPVDVNDRDREAPGDVRGEARGVQGLRRRREADQVVHDDVDRPPTENPSRSARFNVSAVIPARRSPRRHGGRSRALSSAPRPPSRRAAPGGRARAP